MLTREQILAADDLPVRKVETPEWGGFVYVRTLTALDVEKRSEASGGDQEGPAKTDAEFLARWVILAACNEEAEPLFADEDLEALKIRNLTVMQRIVTAAMEHNGLTDKEELAKNSATAPGGD